MTWFSEVGFNLRFTVCYCRCTKIFLVWRLLLCQHELINTPASRYAVFWWWAAVSWLWALVFCCRISAYLRGHSGPERHQRTGVTVESIKRQCFLQLKYLCRDDRDDRYSLALRWSSCRIWSCGAVKLGARVVLVFNQSLSASLLQLSRTRSILLIHLPPRNR